MQDQVTFRIVILSPPTGVDFGLQKGKGSDYETVQTQRSNGSDLYFEFPARLKTGTGNSDPDFSGEYVQGLKDSRFAYIDIGTYAGQADSEWSRRLKIPLTGITRAIVNRSEPILETWVSGTGKDGTPSCGTAKPFDGWKPL